jgi:hypothetical protein
MILKDSMTAAASAGFERIGDFVENMVSPEIRYFRGK